MKDQDKFIKLKDHFAETDSFSDEEFERLISFFTIRTLEKKEFFNMQGYLCKHLAFVNSGCLRAFHTDDKGDEFTMYFAFLNWWVGDKASFYSGTPSRFSVQALEDSEIFYADKTTWEMALDQIPAFEKWYRIKTRKSYEATQQKIIDTQTEDRKSTRLNSSHGGISRMPSSA